jgi:hypothetical protein
MLVQQTLAFDPKSKNTTFGTLPEHANLAVTRSKAPKRKARPKLPSRAKESSSSGTYLSSQGQGSNTGEAECAPRLRKVSYALTKAHVSLLVHAITHTQVIGCPFNRFMTIDWDLAGVTDPWKAQGQYLKYIRDWLNGHGQELAYVWIMERGNTLGLHSHMLLHVPPHLRGRFNGLQRRWLQQSGVPWLRRVRYSRAIGRSSQAAFAQGEGKKAYEANLQIVSDYVLKAAGSTARTKFNLTGATQYSAVAGKRVGTSRNLGTKAIVDHREAHRKRR